MTLTMADSIYTLTIPKGFDAVLGYVDGLWPTIHGYTDSNGVYQPPLAQLFPGVPIIGLTVSGGTFDADGCDIETGDLGPVSGAQWLKNKLATGPKLAPVAYCSVENMGAVVAELAAIGVPRSSVLLLSAHYWDPQDPAGSNYEAHICGPDSCNLIDLPQDGTQWADNGAGNGGLIDLSLLTDTFFGTTTEDEMLSVGQLTIPGTPASTAMIVALTGGDNNIYVSSQAAQGGPWTRVGPIGGALPIAGKLEAVLEIVDNVPNVFVHAADPVAIDNGDTYVSTLTAGAWSAWEKIT